MEEGSSRASPSAHPAIAAATEAREPSAAKRAAEVQEQALRDSANQMLAILPEHQKAFFHRIQDGAPWKGWANCPVEHRGLRPLSSAHDLLARSVDKLSTPRSTT
jgi:hypothetical protein